VAILRVPREKQARRGVRPADRGNDGRWVVERVLRGAYQAASDRGRQRDGSEAEGSEAYRNGLNSLDVIFRQFVRRIEKIPKPSGTSVFLGKS